MSTLFVELGCEEIPARLQKKAISDLANGLCDRLAALGFTAAPGRLAVSPRHMAVEVTGLEAVLPDRSEERRGPRTDAPDKAIDGFCQSAGISRDQLESRDTEKGTFYFAVLHQAGAVLTEVLASVIAQTITTFPWPKSQRWADTTISWVRPLHSVNVLLDGQAVAGRLDLGGGMAIEFGAAAYGHPFYADTPVSLSDFDSYLRDMKAARVLVDHADRRAVIQAQLTDVAATKSLHPVADDGLLDEITGLVEWPNTIIGRIDPAFMALPPEVLVTSMRVHQKFFALSETGAADQLAPYFMTVANRVSDPANDSLIAAGNERVLRARLSDARFFYDQDRATPLAGYTDRLSAVTFYDGLGTVAQKAERMAALAGVMAGRLDGADPDVARRAARLAKADLVTGMVGEFPELQGIMGGYYAAAAGEGADVADAITDHYRPQGPSDAIPATLYGRLVSLADKIDTLVGFFGIGAKPTGSRDPFALRRAALGVLRILDEGDVDLSVDALLADAAALYGTDGHGTDGQGTDGQGFDGVDTDLPGFILDRLRVRLRDAGLGHDVVAAALAMAPEGAVGDVRRWVRLATALDAFLQTEDGALLAGGWRRVASILAAEEKKGTPITSGCDQELFADPAEAALYQAVADLPDGAGRDQQTIHAAMQALAALSGPINRFFDTVVVNADDDAVRANRLSLLAAVREAMQTIADFSQLEG